MSTAAANMPANMPANKPASQPAAGTSSLPALPDFETITVSITDQIAHVVLIRPEKRNAMNKAFWVEFPAAIKAISDSAAARVIVVSSTGKHFTAGMDLAVFAEAGNTIMGGDRDPYIHAEAFRHHLHLLQETFSLSLIHISEPTRPY